MDTSPGLQVCEQVEIVVCDKRALRTQLEYWPVVCTQGGQIS